MHTICSYLFNELADVCIRRETDKPYVVVKVGRQNSVQGSREARIYEYIKSVQSSHPGAGLVRSMLASFELTLDGSVYYGLVHAPLAMSLRDLRKGYVDCRVPVEMVRWVVRNVLLALDFLHESGIVHTGKSSSPLPYASWRPDLLISRDKLTN